MRWRWTRTTTASTTPTPSAPISFTVPPAPRSPRRSGPPSTPRRTGASSRGGSRPDAEPRLSAGELDFRDPRGLPSKIAPLDEDLPVFPGLLRCPDTGGAGDLPRVPATAQVELRQQ